MRSSLESVRGVPGTAGFPEIKTRPAALPYLLACIPLSSLYFLERMQPVPLHSATIILQWASAAPVLFPPLLWLLTSYELNGTVAALRLFIFQFPVELSGVRRVRIRQGRVRSILGFAEVCFLDASGKMLLLWDFFPSSRPFLRKARMVSLLVESRYAKSVQ